MKAVFNLRSLRSAFAVALVAVVCCLVAPRVFAQPSCVPPSGLVGWWAGENNALDSGGTNNGTLAGNATFGDGRVGQGFVFDGNHDGVQLANQTNLQLQTFTIEAWIKRSSVSIASQDVGGGQIFSYGGGGYCLLVDNDGHAYLCKNDSSSIGSSFLITNTNWHHLAATKSGTSVVFYLDGVAYPAGSYGATFSFGSPPAIGARGDSLGNSFLGTIDEVAVYNRALSATEIQSIYVSGKCQSPPVIVAQPQNQTVVVTETASFSVGAVGAQPMNYQWQFNGTNLAGATTNSLTLADVQFNQAGNYTVVITNTLGTNTSSTAVLTVNPPPPCATLPPGAVGWWRGEGNAFDQLGANNGTPAGNTSYSAAKVGQGFVFDGDHDGVRLANQAGFQLQNLTIEAWIKRSSISIASQNRGGGQIFSYGSGGYCLLVDDDGRAFFCKNDSSSVGSSFQITNTSWHHLAATKSGTNVVFYLDGVAYPAAPYVVTFSFTTPPAVGARGDSLGNSFLGSIDEVAVYNRPLEASEIQAIYNAGLSGKCAVPVAPSITTQPASQTVTAGATVNFYVTASGTWPLSYQWRFNGDNIAGATTNSLTLTNVQVSQSGNYSVVVTNVAGTNVSSNAVLTVNFPPAPLRVASTNAAAGSSVTVPVVLVANGNENALGFSLNFATSHLAYASVSLGSGLGTASLFVNDTQAGSGKLGFALSLPAGGTIPAGTTEIVRVRFTTALVTNNTATSVTFGDSPIVRQLSDVLGNSLPASYTAGTVTIAAAEFEGDVSPRPNGDKALTITDWVMVGRYAARLDYPTNGGEFQRADCAPRSSRGNGAIRVSDWVQTGRYAAGLDAATPAGGPTSGFWPFGANVKAANGGGEADGPATVRQVKVMPVVLAQNQAGTLRVNLEALGDENALGFSLTFDPAVFSFAGATVGNGASGATLNVNGNQAGSGQLGFVLALPTGSTFAAGTREIVKVSLRAAAEAKNGYAVSFSNDPVPPEVSDKEALELAADYVNATVIVNPPPELNITRSGQGILLSWALWASNFTPQSADAVSSPINWSNVAATVGVSNNENLVTLPLTGNAKFYRLISP